MCPLVLLSLLWEKYAQLVHWSQEGGASWTHSFKVDVWKLIPFKIFKLKNSHFKLTWILQELLKNSWSDLNFIIYDNIHNNEGSNHCNETHIWEISPGMRWCIGSSGQLMPGDEIQCWKMIQNDKNAAKENKLLDQ